ncbi:C6 finger domain-containing protein [Colletotrichum truncatum]|uniref:C6 finger domain-containing protein n=1 Tax=Colletotrichum truncatum TaxID=5467 RepID=A0ACC3ZB94_COLTU|nr:C6 finger domain-containing protein [Colletotrichum truncatum]KAF6787695.1 C6 finger domain-containing protein [Colletotrichum truncatum]
MGRPPSSGYCHTCRQRRIKCDRARPSCERCLKSGYKCKGYDNPLRMQNLTIGAQPDGGKSLVRVPTESTETMILPEIPVELPLTAFRDRMAFTYLLANYRWAPFWKPLLRIAILEGNEPDAVKFHYMGCLATALAYMGHHVNEPKMISDGYELNGKILHALQSALSAKSKSDIAPWAFTILVLCLYQYAVENKTELPHYRGIIRVIEYCGPEYFQHEPLLTYYRQIRSQHSCNSFNHNEPSFFEKENWKTVPFKYSKKTAYDFLTDVFIDLPGLSASLVRSAMPMSADQKAELEMKTEGLISRLKKWRHQWEVDNPKVATEVWLPLTSEEVSPPWLNNLLSRPLEVRTAEHAAHLLVYNAGVIYLMQILVALRTGVHQPQPFPAEMDPSVAKPADDPLYMPNELKYPWQPSIEALRLMRLAPKLLSIRESTTMIAASPIGIIYNSLVRNDTLSRLFLSTIARPKEYDIIRSELSAFSIPQ